MLGNHGHQRRLPVVYSLVELLRHPLPEISAAAMQALQRLGPPPQAQNGPSPQPDWELMGSKPPKKPAPNTHNPAAGM